MDEFDDLIVEFGRRLATDPHSVDDELHAARWPSASATRRS